MKKGSVNIFMTENNKELKACPFCGNKAIIMPMSYGRFAIGCKVIGKDCPMLCTPTKDLNKCIETWNTRHNEAPTGEIGELIKILKDCAKKFNKMNWQGQHNQRILELNKTIDEIEAHLQQAQKMREILEYNTNLWESMHTTHLYDKNVQKMLVDATNKAKQALNNKG